MTELADRIRGALYGVAVGDALGAPLEFMSAEGIRQQHGYVREMIGGGWLDVRPGEVTDDTQMTLAVAKGIVEQPDDPIPAIGRRFVEWYASRPKDVGATCATSIRKAVAIAQDKANPSSKDWMNASEWTDRSMGGRSAGNGSLMRTAYVGLYYVDENDAFNTAGAISKMTHYDRVAAQDCQAYSVMLQRMVTEPSIEKRFGIIRDVFRIWPCGERYDIDELSCDDYSPEPTGYVVDSFAAALHCVLTTYSFEDAVAKAVNLGGDADTIAAITGGLAGAIYGFMSIPDRWAQKLEPKYRKELYDLCEAAIAARKEFVS
ncbi:MAG: ADP-ribosylglycohydrolase family protein [Eubacteriales bacterium]|nr:ADP-ribosylglycohydrolase family protein [Eubacteriales bacterium]